MSQDLITTITNGYWGDWGNVVTVPDNCYINGMRVRYEAPIDGDDTALNGIEIHYVSLPGSPNPKSGTMVVHPGHWGDWRNWVYAPDGYYIVGFKVRLEDPVGDGDDTALNGIEMICNKFSSPPDDFIHILVEGGNWGDWRSDILAQYPNWGVVGLQVRVEAPVGSGDDTAMNGIRMACRKLF